MAYNYYRSEKLADEKLASEASRSLLALARRIAQVYAAHPNAMAIILTGSAAEGESDHYSDLDIILYYDKLPAAEELLAAFQHNEGRDHRLLGQAGEEKIESYLVDGVECQCAHTTIAAWERDMAVVLEQLDVTTPLQKALSGMLEALPLYGESLVRRWQASSRLSSRFHRRALSSTMRMAAGFSGFSF